MQELLAYMAGIEILNELKNATTKNMQAVEECNNGGATAYLVIAETKAEAKQAEKGYSLCSCLRNILLLDANSFAFWCYKKYKVVASKSVQLRKGNIKDNTAKAVLSFMVLPTRIELITNP